MSEDTISRQAAIDALADYIHNVDKVYSTGKLSADDCKDAAKSVLDELPSAQPKRGRWLPVKRCDGGYWVCSSCKNPTEAFAANVLYKYCPFCGADMRKQKSQYGDEDTSQGGLMSAT